MRKMALTMVSSVMEHFVDYTTLYIVDYQVLPKVYMCHLPCMSFRQTLLRRKGRQYMLKKNEKRP